MSNARSSWPIGLIGCVALSCLLLAPVVAQSPEEPVKERALPPPTATSYQGFQVEFLPGTGRDAAPWTSITGGALSRTLANPSIVAAEKQRTLTAGPPTVEPLELTRTMVQGDNEIREWLRNAANLRDLGEVYRDIAVVPLGRDGTQLESISYMRCVPSRYVFPKLDRVNPAPMSETLVVVATYLEGHDSPASAHPATSGTTATGTTSTGSESPPQDTQPPPAEDPPAQPPPAEDPPAQPPAPPATDPSSEPAGQPAAEQPARSDPRSRMDRLARRKRLVNRLRAMKRRTRTRAIERLEPFTGFRIEAAFLGGGDDCAWVESVEIGDLDFNVSTQSFGPTGVQPVPGSPRPGPITIRYPRGFAPEVADWWKDASEYKDRTYDVTIALLLPDGSNSHQVFTFINCRIQRWEHLRIENTSGGWRAMESVTVVPEWIELR